MPGLYAGETVRCEYFGTGAWQFWARCRCLDLARRWYEYAPMEAWHPLGRWLRRRDGLQAAEQLRAGTHFWDEDLHRTRLYTPEIYAVLREED